ncbi:hypothetical protein [Pseudocitrobacter cyperus]|uniref:Uncharacterized protein n=1 Tax=Pseudocitrobacter cyperus TaxID=3112843 RepID=A0ABV0HLR3_9ENTR
MKKFIKIILATGVLVFANNVLSAPRPCPLNGVSQDRAVQTIQKKLNINVVKGVIVPTEYECVFIASITDNNSTHYYRVIMADEVKFTPSSKSDWEAAYNGWQRGEAATKPSPEPIGPGSEDNIMAPEDRAWQAKQKEMSRTGDIAGLMGITDPKQKAKINKDPFSKDVRDMVQNICKDINRQQMSLGNTRNLCTMAFPVRVLGNNNYIAQMQVGGNIVRVRFDMSGNYEEIH